MLHTVSSTGEYESCERRYRYKHIDLVRPRIAGKARNVGSLLHTGLELFHADKSVDESLAVIARAVATDEFFCSPEGQIEYHRTRAMLRAYFSRWAEMRQAWKVVAVERVFEFEIAPGVMFAGKLDLVAERDDVLYVWDHKSSSDEIANVGTDFWQHLAIDKQIVTYSEAVLRLFGRMPAILWDVVGKPGGKPKGKTKIARRKAETDEQYEKRKADNLETLEEFEERLVSEMLATPDEYLVRREVHRTAEQHAELLAEVVETCRRIDAHQGPWVRNDRACQSKYGTCQYLGVCAGVETLDSERFEKIDAAHPELAGEASDALDDCPL